MSEISKVFTDIERLEHTSCNSSIFLSIISPTTLISELGALSRINKICSKASSPPPMTRIFFFTIFRKTGKELLILYPMYHYNFSILSVRFSIKFFNGFSTIIFINGLNFPLKTNWTSA